MPNLSWLPSNPDWGKRLTLAEAAGIHTKDSASILAMEDLDFVSTDRLDRFLRRSVSEDTDTEIIRLTMLGSSSLSHLEGAIRVAGRRNRFIIQIQSTGYGQYLQNLIFADDNLRNFKPHFIFIALDFDHILAELKSTNESKGANAALQSLFERLLSCWHAAKRLGSEVIQQTALPAAATLLGQNEYRMVNAPGPFLRSFNARLRNEALKAGVVLLAIDEEVGRHGIPAFFDPAIWLRTKQEISPRAAPYYGDLVVRLIAACRGQSAKCLIVDLDNTLWGGTIGDDGIEGIKLGRGSAEGEAYTALQEYIQSLARRGIVLAVCSKNDFDLAISPFKNHPEMILKLSDIACFVANWKDKATNIRYISKDLNLSLDSLVFLDDNPAERALIRRELPSVRVIELPDDPALTPSSIALSGWFESINLTEEDLMRSNFYNKKHDQELTNENPIDVNAYLVSLRMRLLWKNFDMIGLPRVLQLINKTNQFNLTGRRYTEGELISIANSTRKRGIQFRLVDNFGDNGIIAVIILQIGNAPKIETWLMSCRVLGRDVELAMLNVIVKLAKRQKSRSLRGEFISTGRNEGVRELYPRLGFAKRDCSNFDSAVVYELDLDTFIPKCVPIKIEEG